MKASPLQIDGFEYPTVCVRASRTHDERRETADGMIVTVNADVNFDADGKHFAMIAVKQEDPKFAYTFEFEAFTSFRIDIGACRDNYANGVSPSMLAVNAARLLYSGVRELLASITARAPYGVAMLPSTTLGTEDVVIRFEKGKRDTILTEFFDYSPEKLETMKKRLAAAKKAANTKKKPLANLSASTKRKE